MTTDAWGIDDGYHDWRGRWHEAPTTTLEGLRAAMGPPAGEAGEEAATRRPVWTFTSGQQPELHSPGTLTLEDGSSREVDATLPADLPLGYHHLDPHDGGLRTLVVVAPERFPDPPVRAWGLAAQLYALRSSRSWGLGDLGDLRALGTWMTARGGSALLINPLGATAPGPGQQPSPYYPGSRLFRSVLYLDITAIPGVGELAGDLAPLRAVAEDLRTEPLVVERDRAWQAKSAALARLWRRQQEAHPAQLEELAAWRAAAGPELEAFATFSALAEGHGGNWRDWPAELRHPTSPAVAVAGGALGPRVAFHAWCQFQLDRQLADAGRAAPLVGDLSVGFDPSGFDAWWWQDALALDARVGAPPDEFNTVGQDWGLPPFIPGRLLDTGLEPLRTTFRAALRHMAGLRIDHVMGLFRLFWIPPGTDASGGTYVRYPWREALDVLALEAHRAGAFVVGEDLGTVEDHVRQELDRRGTLSTKLVWFEDRPPGAWPAQALGSVTTHDLPTVAGVWGGTDAADQVAAGLPANPEGDQAMRRRLTAAAGVAPDAAVGEVIREAHRALGASGATLVLAALDDLVGAVHRPNLPGTVDEAPNWRRPLPVPLEELMADPQVAEVLDALAAGRRSDPAP